MFTKLLIFLLLLAVFALAALLMLRRQRQGQNNAGQASPGRDDLLSRMLATLRNRPGDYVAVFGHVVAALVIIYGIFPGMYDWTSRFLISPFPWGLLFVAGVLTWIGVILHRAMKGRYTVLSGLGAVLLFLVITCVVVQVGRLFGTWAGWNIFGADPHTYTSKLIPVGQSEDHTFVAKVPMREEYHTTSFEMRTGQILKVISITSEGADVSGLSDDGYQGCNAHGAVADTGDGVLRNLIAGTEALRYEAKLWSLWRRRPPNKPVRTDEIRWNVANPKAPYGAVLFELNGEKKFLEEGAEVEIDGNQTLGFFINLERTKFKLNDAGKPRGSYIVKFVIM